MGTEEQGLGGDLRLGGRSVARVGFGMGSLGRTEDSAASRGRGVSVLRQAFDDGVRIFDTAHFYGAGHANSLLAEAFAGNRDEVVVATKAGARATPEGPAPMTAAQHPDELRASVEDNLATLASDYVDIVYLRRMDFRPGLVVEEDQMVNLEDQLAELIALREEGKVRGIGLSHVRKEQVEAALPAGIVAVQNIYNLLDRRDEGLLELCRDHDAAWIPYFPLGGGGSFFGLPRVVDDPVVIEIAHAMGVTPQQVGMAWLLEHSPNTAVISGTSNPDHLRENLSAGRISLDAEAMRRLDARHVAGD